MKIICKTKQIILTRRVGKKGLGEGRVENAEAPCVCGGGEGGNIPTVALYAYSGPSNLESGSEL